MQKPWLMKLFIIGSVLGGLIGGPNSMAQEAEYRLAHQDIFGKLRRPPVSFAHEKHAVTLESAGCGICHHVPDDRSGKLVYAEGEESSCKECHDQRKDNHIPA